MQKITRLLENLFADPERPIENLTAGFLAHNALFQVAPDPAKVLPPNQANTNKLAKQLTQLTTTIGSSQARQQAGRDLTLADQTTALERLRQNQAALQNDYLVADAQERARLLALLYPQGMSAFTNAPLKTLPELLRVFLDLVQDPANNVPTPIVSKSVADLTPFATSRTAQLTQMQATEQARIERRALLPALEEQLTRNLHALCFLFEANRALVASYFDSTYFEDQATGRQGRHAGIVALHHTNQVLDLGTAPARFQRLRLHVDEPHPLLFFRAADARQPAPPTALAVTSAAPLTLPLAQLPGTGPLLLVANPGAYVGHYLAELLPAEGEDA